MARESNVSRDHRGVPFLLPSTTPSTQSMVQRLEGLSGVPSPPPSTTPSTQSLVQRYKLLEHGADVKIYIFLADMSAKNVSLSVS